MKGVNMGIMMAGMFGRINGSGKGRGLASHSGDNSVGLLAGTGLIGSGIPISTGLALWGRRPVAEIMFSDFLTLAMNHVVNSAAKMRYAYAGEGTVPVVFRTAFGAGVGAALHHSQSPEAWIANVPGQPDP